MAEFSQSVVAAGAGDVFSLLIPGARSNESTATSEPITQAYAQALARFLPAAPDGLQESPIHVDATPVNAPDSPALTAPAAPQLPVSVPEDQPVADNGVPTVAVPPVLTTITGTISADNQREEAARAKLIPEVESPPSPPPRVEVASAVLPAPATDGPGPQPADDHVPLNDSVVPPANFQIPQRPEDPPVLSATGETTDGDVALPPANLANLVSPTRPGIPTPEPPAPIGGYDDRLLGPPRLVVPPPNGKNTPARHSGSHSTNDATTEHSTQVPVDQPHPGVKSASPTRPLDQPVASPDSVPMAQPPADLGLITDKITDQAAVVPVPDATPAGVDPGAIATAHHESSSDQPTGNIKTTPTSEQPVQLDSPVKPAPGTDSSKAPESHGQPENTAVPTAPTRSHSDVAQVVLPSDRPDIEVPTAPSPRPVPHRPRPEGPPKPTAGRSETTPPAAVPSPVAKPARNRPSHTELDQTIRDPAPRRDAPPSRERILPVGDPIPVPPTELANAAPDIREAAPVSTQPTDAEPATPNPAPIHIFNPVESSPPQGIETPAATRPQETTLEPVTPVPSAVEPTLESTPATETNPPASEPRSTEIVQQAIRAVRASVERNRPFRVTLQPPELGPLKINIARVDGAVTIQMQVETAAAQQSLQEQLVELQSSLARNGVNVERIDIQLTEPRTGRQETQQQTSENSRQSPHQRQRRDDGGHKRHDPPTDEEETSDKDTARRKDAQG